MKYLKMLHLKKPGKIDTLFRGLHSLATGHQRRGCRKASLVVALSILSNKRSIITSKGVAVQLHKTTLWSQHGVHLHLIPFSPDDGTLGNSIFRKRSTKAKPN